MGRFYVRSFWKGLCWESLHRLIHRAGGFLSLGPAFPKYLSHRGILVLGAKCWSADASAPPVQSALHSPATPGACSYVRQRPHLAPDLLLPLPWCCFFRKGFLCFHSGWNIPNNVFGNRGLGMVTSFYLNARGQFIFQGMCLLWPKMWWQLWGRSRDALNCLVWAMTGVYSRPHGDHKDSAALGTSAVRPSAGCFCTLVTSVLSQLHDLCLR